MKFKLPRIKPASKTSSGLHILLNIGIALLILLSIRQGFALLAVGILFLSKWRMVAVKPRHWLANIRANLVDMSVGVSVITYMSATNSLTSELIYTALYVFWLVWLKPKSSHLWVMIQALLAQTIALVALYSSFGNWTVPALVLSTWLICYASARHFFSSYEEPNTKILAHIWGLFGAELAWLMSHWTLFYGFLPQIALVLSVVSYAFVATYHMHMTRGLKPSLRNQFIIVTVVVLLVIVLFSQWQYAGL